MGIHTLNTAFRAGFFDVATILPPQALTQPDEPSPYYFASLRPKQLQQMLFLRNRFFLETSPYATLQAELERLLRVAPDFAVYMSSRTAFEGDVCKSITQTLCERFNLGSISETAIRTCLQEVVTNALVHGNLGLKMHDDDGASFYGFMDLVQQRIQEPLYHSRRIGILAWQQPDGIPKSFQDLDYRTTVRREAGGFGGTYPQSFAREGYIIISVTDEGQGFPSQSLDCKSQNNYCGRGLMLVQSIAEHVWIEADLKTLSMRFSL